MYNHQELTSSVVRPNSSSMATAPGCKDAPFIMSCCMSRTLWCVTGSGNVSFLAKIGGTPISFVSMFTSGEMTDRAAKLTRLPWMIKKKDQLLDGCSENHRQRTIMFILNKPSFFSRTCFTPAVGSLPPRVPVGFFLLSIRLLTAC